MPFFDHALSYRIAKRGRTSVLVLEALRCEARERSIGPKKVSLVKVPRVCRDPRPANAASLGRNSFQCAQDMAQPNDRREHLHTHSDMEIEKASQVLT